MSPRVCARCDEPISYESAKEKRTKFCSQSCSASTNNLGVCRVTKVEEKRVCGFCTTEYDFKKGRNGEIYCSQSCQSRDIDRGIMEKFERGEIRTRATIRKVLIILRGNQCSVCKITDWNGSPITFQVDHHDGNAGNDHPENLRLICPNCHSQTSTWGGRNKGNGRKARGLPEG